VRSSANHLQRCLDILHALPPLDEPDASRSRLAEGAAMPDDARRRLFDEWFAGAHEEPRRRAVA
jgi:hypothetical protein